MHKTAYEDGKQFVDKYLSKDNKLLIGDVGSYDVNGTLKPLLTGTNWSYEGLDIASGPNVDYVIDEVDSSWLHERYDVIVSTQVLEHVRKPWKWIVQITDWLKPGGLLYICTPYRINYHPYPVDCWRTFPDGMKALFEEAPLDVLEAYMSPEDRAGIGDTTGIARKKS